MSQKKLCVIMGYGLAIGQVALEALIESGYSVAIVARNLERLKATEQKYSAEGHVVKGCKKIIISASQ
jgi:short-subunit dehydrogenase